MRRSPRWPLLLALSLAASCGGATRPETLGPPADPAIAAHLGSAQRVRFPASDRPARGADTPLVTMVVFTDYECPFCARLAPTLERLRRRYGEDLREVVVMFPLDFHARARPAATLALEALAQRGPEGFFAAHDLLGTRREALEDGDLATYARSLGLDAARTADALARNRHRARIDADVRAARAMNVQGVPLVLLNGRPIVGARSYETYAEVVDDELRIARAALRDGVAREAYADWVLRGSPADPLTTARREPRMHDGERYAIPLGPREFARGPADAIVTVVEYGGYECPFTRRVEPDVVRLLATYPRDVRVVFRDYPLPMHYVGQDATALVAEIRRRRGDEHARAAHAALFEARSIDAATLRAVGARAGLPEATLARLVDGHEGRAAAHAMAREASQLGLEGSPTFFVNGRVLLGARPFEELRAVVEEELARARELVASGVPRQRVYARAIAGSPERAPTRAP